ncbi:MAG: secondary thiamine-phosphate synthase enzyme YjbQ [Nanoarchaeota archaeon]|nr:secondary thiamine-phosphate synthase enzyme YjbQ [Nanoarchaeota archaeon]
MQKEIIIATRAHNELIDITKEVEKIVSESKVEQGLCNVFVAHATAAILINENYDPNLRDDIIKALNQTIPERNNYKHDQIDNNAASHIKAAIIGPSETIPVKDSKLLLGTWQSIAFCEFDGPRSNRKIIITITNQKI